MRLPPSVTLGLIMAGCVTTGTAPPPWLDTTKDGACIVARVTVQRCQAGAETNSDRCFYARVVARSCTSTEGGHLLDTTPKLAQKDRADYGLSYPINCGESILRDSAVCRKVADLANLCLGKPSPAIPDPSLVGAVSNTVALVFSGRSPVEIFCPVVAGNPVLVTGLLTIKAGTDEGRENELMHTVFLSNPVGEFEPGVPSTGDVSFHANTVESATIEWIDPIEGSNGTQRADFVDSFVAGDGAPFLGDGRVFTVHAPSFSGFVVRGVSGRHTPVPPANNIIPPGSPRPGVGLTPRSLRTC